MPPPTSVSIGLQHIPLLKDRIPQHLISAVFRLLDNQDKYYEVHEEPPDDVKIYFEAAAATQLSRLVEETGQATTMLEDLFPAYFKLLDRKDDVMRLHRVPKDKLKGYFRVASLYRSFSQ